MFSPMVHLIEIKERIEGAHYSGHKKFAIWCQMAFRRKNPKVLARPLAGLMAVLALLIQFVLPSWVQASALSWDTMIEICSEAGPVLIRLDSEDTPDAPGSNDACPKCQSCAICAAGNSIVGETKHFSSKRMYVTQVIYWDVSQDEQSSKELKKTMARGPPSASHLIIDRLSRAVPALTLDQGAAL